MGRVINTNGQDCMSDNKILDNLKEMLDKGMDVDEVLALRMPSFLLHNRADGKVLEAILNIVAHTINRDYDGNINKEK